ncbi:LOW QUALITY PROTEIN: hypothetical protein PHMEG_0008462 [Phytophthora megakarya]|uniref:Reverse transcriptase/retrotransposon-derived protein RNase H-like domain-containing protein n=1 Tax=Phytophthora megakarya TaxID=4795 RepID=A0A225WIZ4_9STRA|nr:LOW QUALITY PROTEIN: hypothetical protein PHMEG_0008462 [Phytophthora megakarya]
MDSPFHFQNQMNMALDDMPRAVATRVCHVFPSFFSRVRQLGPKLIVVKISLFRKATMWCAQRLHGLYQLPLASTAAELLEDHCATGWMRNSLMYYSPLHGQLGVVLIVVGRTKRLTAGAANDTQDTSASEQTLHYPSQEVKIVLMSDASDRGVGLLVTHVRNWVDVVSVTVTK